MTAPGTVQADGEAAQSVAQRLGIQSVVGADMALQFESGKLCLHVPGSRPFAVDLERALTRTRTAGGRRRHVIARALGRKPGLRVLDATAGWGRDAVTMAALGYEVLACERSAVVFALLEDAVRRLAMDPPLVRLHLGDATDLLRSLSNAALPDVVFLDPMLPPRRKSALVKRDLQLLQWLLGKPDEAEAAALLELARKCVSRVVVKRPLKAPPLDKPSHAVQGNKVRFDVYLS